MNHEEQSANPMNPPTTTHDMKTMMELLIRLQQLRRCCERTARNNQLTDGEKNSARFFKMLVRDCLPKEVLVHYDRMKETETELLECPDVFAMAVLVSTYRGLSPRKRRRLIDHFATSPGAAAPGKGHTAIRLARTVRPRLHRAARMESRLHPAHRIQSRGRPVLG